MVGIAAGMSTCGKVPLQAHFAMFAAGRAFDQLKHSRLPTSNVKIGATQHGISVGEDSAINHQCNEDIALIRTIRNDNY